jgi:hypothetical protein
MKPLDLLSCTRKIFFFMVGPSQTGKLYFRSFYVGRRGPFFQKHNFKMFISDCIIFSDQRHREYQKLPMKISRVTVVFTSRNLGTKLK